MSETAELVTWPDMNDPEIQALLNAASVPAGTRNDTILKILNAAGKSGWTNHQILAAGSELAIRWGVSSPDRNLFEHWSRQMKMLGNVRSHYPSPQGDRAGAI